MEQTHKELLTLSLNAENHQSFNNGLKNFSVSFLCGCFGGIANILSSHPFDTIKVRMQILDMKLTNSFKNIVAKEGFGALYKGISSPLFNVPLIYAVYFGTYEIGKWLQGVKIQENPTMTQAMVAGAGAGFAVCSIMTPVELIKCRLQMAGTGVKGKTITALAMAKKIIKEHGVREIYKGNLITLCREIPATAVYFGTYEYLSRKLKIKYGEINWIPIVAGGVAGLLSWIVSYPQDIIKTKLQCDAGAVRSYSNNKLIKDGGIINCTKEIMKQKGISGFTKGFSACAIKAVLAEAATFFVYENMKKHVKF